LSEHPWTVIIPEDIAEEISNYPPETQIDFFAKVDEIEEYPYNVIHKMRDFPFYKFNVKGNYRGIVTVSGKKLIINLLRFRHRDLVYRALEKIK